MENEISKRNTVILAWMFLGILVLANVGQIGGILQSIVKMILNFIPHSIKMMKVASVFIALVILGSKILLFAYLLKAALKNTILMFPKKLYLINLILLLITYFINSALFALSSVVIAKNFGPTRIGELTIFNSIFSASNTFLNTVFILIIGIIVYNKLKPPINSTL